MLKKFTYLLLILLCISGCSSSQYMEKPVRKASQYLIETNVDLFNDLVKDNNDTDIFEGIRWGMTPEDINKKRPLALREEMHFKKNYEYDIYHDDKGRRLKFMDNALVSLTININREVSKVLTDEITKKYGSPIKSENIFLTEWLTDTIYIKKNLSAITFESRSFYDFQKNEAEFEKNNRAKQLLE